MQTLLWSRSRAIREARQGIWRHVSASALTSDDVLQALALLKLGRSSLQRLADLHFVASPEVGAFLDTVPAILRRLPTTTVAEEEVSRDRLRGAPRWGRTFAARASGLRGVYVTAPARRAYETPTNHLLVFLLDAVRRAGERTGLTPTSVAGIGTTISERTRRAEEGLRVRALLDLEREPLKPLALARVRNGRHASRYAAAINAYELHASLVESLDRERLRRAVEETAIVTAADSTLLELVCTFRILDTLVGQGWRLRDPGVFEGGFKVSGHRDAEELTIHYQHTPPELQRVSQYAAVQRAHGFRAIGGLIPDLVLDWRRGDERRFLLVEVKGLERSVAASARVAMLDLFAYGRAFARILDQDTAAPYGLGIAWGAGLAPVCSEQLMLCTPDQLGKALNLSFPRVAPAS